MKNICFPALLLIFILSLAGCGNNDNPPPPPPPSFVAQIVSDPALDGDIFRDFFVPPGYTVTQGMTPTVQRVFFGKDPTPGSGGDYRAFLNFHLGGAGGVPLNAVIDSALLDLFITSPTAGVIPITVDLVSYPQPLVSSDFGGAFLATTTMNILVNQANVAQQVSLDLTHLMVEAQRLALSAFQVRILWGGGVISIDDTTGPNRGVFAPLLQVTYF